LFLVSVLSTSATYLVNFSKLFLRFLYSWPPTSII
jgi:hypothetical protein